MNDRSIPTPSPKPRPPAGIVRAPTKTYTRVSVVMPCYNESRTLRTVVEKVAAAAIPLEKEIILVDDGSKDGTREVIAQIEREFPSWPIAANSRTTLRAVFHEKNRGKGAALRTGFAAATGDIILVQDADLEYDPEDYVALIKPITDGVARVVYGSRWFNRHFHHRLDGQFWFLVGNWVLTTLTNVLYRANITDEATCYKVFDADVLRAIDLKCEGFEFCPEVTAKVRKAGHKIWEVPVYYYPRSIDEGKKIRYTHGIDAAWMLIRERFTR